MMLQAGKLDQRITLQSRVPAVNALGEDVYTWGDVATVWAQAEPLAGREYFAASAVQSEATTRFRIRWRAGVDTTMRVLWRGEPYALVAPPIDVDGGRHTLELMTVQGGRDAR